MKSSKSRRFLGLRPRPRWGSLRRSLRPPSREGLLAFGNRSFAPSALSPFLAPQTKIRVLLAPQTQNPKTATVWESLRRSPRPPSREGLLAFGNRGFTRLRRLIPVSPQTKIPAPVSPQTQNPRT